MEDGALTLCLVLAADRYQYAVMRGGCAPWLLAGVWVGLGFQAKMLEAWIILPALALGYLVSAPAAVRRRRPTWRGRRRHAGGLAVLDRRSTRSRRRPTGPTSTARPTTARSRWSSATTALARFGIHVPGRGYVQPRCHVR